MKKKEKEKKEKKERILSELWNTYQKAGGSDQGDGESYKFDGKVALKALELIAKISGVLDEAEEDDLSTEGTKISIHVLKDE